MDNDEIKRITERLKDRPKPADSPDSDLMYPNDAYEPREERDSNEQ